MLLALSAIRKCTCVCVCVWKRERERESMLSKGFELVWQLFSSLFSPPSLILLVRSRFPSPCNRCLYSLRALRRSQTECSRKQVWNEKGPITREWWELGRKRVKRRKITTDSMRGRRQLKITSSWGRNRRGKGRRGAKESANQANDLNL